MTLSYDTTLHAGTETHPIGVNENLARVTALMADEARTHDPPAALSRACLRPAADAARTFADFLEWQHGITASPPGSFKGDLTAPTPSPPSPRPHLGVPGRADADPQRQRHRRGPGPPIPPWRPARPPTSTGLRRRSARLKQLGLPVRGARSPLRQRPGTPPDRITAELLTACWPRPPTRTGPSSGPISHRSSPVAGFTGIADQPLHGRRGRPGPRQDRHLTGVNTLAGTMVTEEGLPPASPSWPSDTTDVWAAQNALDRLATTLASSSAPHAAASAHNAGVLPNGLRPSPTPPPTPAPRTACPQRQRSRTR
ncbi:hypothetical protein LV779_31730 [Streptomyces thinghirensis]|nr:hypothetical protein [Streptomyces thinghirensis]